MESMNSYPAICGGQPAFSGLVPIVRPVLPGFEELSGGVHEILQSGMATKGKHLRAFEEMVARHLGVKHAVGVSSCTSGLILTYKGLGLTGEVVVPSFTFMATVGAMVWCGLKPVFADVDPGTTDLIPEAAEAAITPRTSAIVAVHNFGNPADIPGLETLARSHGLKLVFDAAHGFGALYRGKPVGPQGNAQVFSMSPTKLLITGEGGLVATDDDELASRIRIGREYGNSGRYDSAFAGLNARLAEFNALMGVYSLQRLEEAARSRNRSVQLYHRELGKLPGIGFQEVCEGDRCSYKDFSITVDAGLFGLTRDDLARALEAENVDTRTYYDPPVHRQSAYARYHDGRSLPHTDWLAANSLSLPIWSDMPDEVVLGICHAFQRVHAHRDAVHHKLAAGIQ
jgi:dTDP-4-amino-4,6-dideoxygalactose transaminase